MNIQKAIIIILLVFISGCIHGGAQTTPEDFGSGLFGTDKGVIFELSELPPAISSNQAFDLEVSATNAGAYSVNPGDIKVSLSNFKSFDFNLKEDFYQLKVGENGLTNNNILLKSLDADVLGASSLFLFEGMSYKTKPPNDIQVPLTIDTCYYYNSVASINICVAEDTLSEICSSSEVKQVVNQGAPVKITAVEQIGSILTNKKDITSNIRIDISAAGEGKFESYSPGNPDKSLACTHPVDDIRLNTVRLKSIQVGSQQAITGREVINVCGSDIINLDIHGEGSISCNSVLLYSQYSDSIGDFEERMVITLDYLNSNSITEKLNILAL